MTGQPMARARSLTEFQEAVPDEASCAAFLFERRWPGGFVCPVCGKDRAAALKSRAYTYECSDCGRQTSVTAGRGAPPRRHGAAPHQAAADSLVLGRASDVDAFQRNVGTAVGGSARPHL